VKITGVILCGGRGTRTGGADKPLLNWRGKPMISHVHDRLRPQVDDIIISANRNLKTYSQWGDAVTDNLADYPGPLAGLQACLAKIGGTADLAVVCPGDGPHLPENLVARLREGHQMDGISVVHDGDRLQPIYQLLSPALVDDLGVHLKSGRRSVQSWLDTQRVRVVDFSGSQECFININDRHDLDACTDQHTPPARKSE
jgi:molybdopterin-guanine dinucleotide biosynthesis protein A